MLPMRAAPVWLILLGLTACAQPTELLPPQLACDVGNVLACASVGASDL